MRLSKDLINKPIITIDEGRVLGTVKDVMLSADLEQLAGIFIGREGLLRRKQVVIRSADVVVFGIDAILVRDAAAVTDSKQESDVGTWVRLNKLQGREVDSPGGTRVGIIGDVVLDEAGAILGYALSRIFVEGPIADQRIIYRHAVIDAGNEDGVMTVDIRQAESPTPLPPVVEEAAVQPAEARDEAPSADETSADETSADETPVDEAPADEVPTEEAAPTESDSAPAPPTPPATPEAPGEASADEASADEREDAAADDANAGAAGEGDYWHPRG